MELAPHWESVGTHLWLDTNLGFLWLHRLPRTGAGGMSVIQKRRPGGTNPNPAFPNTRTAASVVQYSTFFGGLPKTQ